MKGARVSKKVRLPTGHTVPWSKVLHDWNLFTSANPQWEPMRQLVHDLHSCASSELHATFVMGGNLLISPEMELFPNNNVLLVSYNYSQRKFHFEHRTVSKHNDTKDATIDEAWATLRLFVGYKFGVRLPEARPIEKIA